MLKNTIVALDQLSIDEIEALMPRLNEFDYFKLGLELFNAHGREYISHFARKYNKNIFLDLKLHDIPKTVSQSIKSLNGLPINFLTIHLSGGREMAQAAIEAKNQFIPDTKILGVSYLTSLGTNDFAELYGIDEAQINTHFKRLFRLGASCQIDGLISSPHELKIIREVETERNYNFIKITPGIRFSNNSSDDQKRVMTPAEAFSQQANYIVMGRSITKAPDIDNVIKKLKN